MINKLALYFKDLQMATDNTDVKNPDKSFIINTAPTVLSIRDVVVVLGVVFAVASSYFTSDNRHTAAETKIKNITEQVDGIKKQVDEYNSKISELSTDYKIMVEQNKGVQKDIDDLKSRVRDLERKK